LIMALALSLFWASQIQVAPNIGKAAQHTRKSL